MLPTPAQDVSEGKQEEEQCFSYKYATSFSYDIVVIWDLNSAHILADNSGINCSKESVDSYDLNVLSFKNYL